LKERDEEVVDRLRRDLELSDDVLARGTPHFFINGKRLSGARPIEQFEALIDHGKQRAAKLVTDGVKPEKVYAHLQKGAASPGLPEKITGEIPSDGRPNRGANDAPIIVHVFSDFQCPYCREGEGNLEELLDLYPKKLRVVWHDFPLEFHERARPAARVARLAFEKKGNDGFWQMHGLLFGLTKAAPGLSDEQILAYAKKVGLSEASVREALDGPLYDEDIDAEMELGESFGIRGTPAYVIGGYLVTGAKPLRFLERVVELALRDQRKKDPTSASPDDKAMSD
jgi:protein-disulfide isomerase